MRLFDTHAHMDDKSFNDDREALLRQAQAAGVERIVNVGYDIPSSERSVQLAEDYPFIYAAVGIHPHDAEGVDEDDYRSLERMAAHPKVVAIGEIGLDYYRDLSPRDCQREVFVNQLALARRLDKPVIIHDRDAHGDIMAILDQEARGLSGVLHCFSGSWEMARFCLDLGFYISLAGPVTYTNARGLLDIARQVPRDRLLVETDSPYLSPHPLRGTRNHSGNVALVAKKVAELRGDDPDELAEQLLHNGCALFRLPFPAQRENP
ncbi:YchF/TatD family DNA exonuclease [Heliobacterium gestii]|uniref:YchF/TatD family DNA exonuclease n=1 Tax=Heliomicrobium gestii TaxID=2699 RepID=A0A845L8A1_HELGE|nr:TatD family hydrolase [Heliomicrobium gestii]MBM7866363.1 TatD DNase family protein [Heliomicrobium gestii]MZP42852.1 YchF/TatD family DNA exonuclease [Heliomicrobium gestii]